MEKKWFQAIFFCLIDFVFASPLFTWSRNTEKHASSRISDGKFFHSKIALFVIVSDIRDHKFTFVSRLISNKLPLVKAALQFSMDNRHHKRTYSRISLALFFKRAQLILIYSHELNWLKRKIWVWDVSNLNWGYCDFFFIVQYINKQLITYTVEYANEVDKPWNTRTELPFLLSLFYSTGFNYQLSCYDPDFISFQWENVSFCRDFILSKT